MKKKVLAMMLCLVLAVGVLPTGALAANVIDSGKCGKNVNWKLTDDGTMTISGTGEMDKQSYAGTPWFDYSLSIITVIIDEGIVNISSCSFAHCWSIKNVTIPNSVTLIDQNAFQGCGIVNITLPNSLKTIEAFAFSFCGLESIEIPDNVSYIGVGAFDSCRSLTSISIPGNIKEIPSDMLYNCESLTSITIPKQVRKIGYNAFAGSAISRIVFTGNAPEIESDENGGAFFELRATAYYPTDNDTWKDIVDNNKQFGGNITWVPYNPDQPKGDVDGDGKVANSDLIMVARYVVDIIDVGTKADVELFGDMNGDGVITNADIITIARIIVGLD